MNVAPRALRVASLFSGGGGLDLGLHLATGGAARAVVYVEREAYAAMAEKRSREVTPSLFLVGGAS